MIQCPNCGMDAGDSSKFCRQCGARMPQGEDAATWRLPPKTEPAPAPGTQPVGNQTAEPPNFPTQPAYMPPGGFYEPAPPVPYQREAEFDQKNNIALGDWLSNGWRVYRENWSLMSIAALIGGFLSLCTAGVLAGPLLMGMYKMAFRTMRGEQPQLGDMFNFEGRFLQAFLAFLIYAAIQFGIPGGKGGGFAILSFLISPIMTMLLAFILPLILERKMDVVQAVNKVFKLIFSRDWLMWWIVGLVFSAIVSSSVILCGVGIFVAAPWIISSAAIAYRDIFGLDDPNRTMH